MEVRSYASLLAEKQVLPAGELGLVDGLFHLDVGPAVDEVCLAVLAALLPDLDVGLLVCDDRSVSLVWTTALHYFVDG